MRLRLEEIDVDWPELNGLRLHRIAGTADYWISHKGGYGFAQLEQGAAFALAFRKEQWPRLFARPKSVLEVEITTIGLNGSAFADAILTKPKSKAKTS